MQTYNNFNELAAGQGQPLVSDMSTFNVLEDVKQTDLDAFRNAVKNLGRSMKPVFSSLFDHAASDETAKKIYGLMNEIELTFDEINNLLAKSGSSLELIYN